MSKSSQKRRISDLPELEQLKNELGRERYRRRYFSVIRSTVYMLITVAAVAVLVATLWMPVLRIYGHSMSPTLDEGEIVLTWKTSQFQAGDTVAFYYNNKILVKRVIGVAGDWVDIDADGNVSVNRVPLEEPYVQELALGECNIELPYQVPDGRLFVMGDNRASSVDSRNTAVGCVAEEQLVGRIVMTVWPLSAVKMHTPVK